MSKMDSWRFGRDSRPHESFPEKSAAAIADLAPKQISGSQVYRRPDAAWQLKLANAKIDELRADNQNKDAQIAAFQGEMVTREDRFKVELDQKVAAARQQASKEEIELRMDLKVSESVQDDLWAENRILKAQNREQKKALSEYHVIYSLQKAYDTHYRKLDWYKQREADRLHAKYKSADGNAIKAAYELYAYLEDNGLDGTLKLNPELKKSLKWLVDKNERR